MKTYAERVKAVLGKKKITMTDFAKKHGFSNKLFSNVIYGRTTDGPINKITKIINDELGVTGKPDNPNLPSVHWRLEAKCQMVKKKLLVRDVAANIGLPVDTVSQVLNGVSTNRVVIDMLDDYLEIKVPAF